jgi:hypothetical protein
VFVTVNALTVSCLSLFFSSDHRELIKGNVRLIGESAIENLHQITYIPYAQMLFLEIMLLITPLAPQVIPEFSFHSCNFPSQYFVTRENSSNISSTTEKYETTVLMEQDYS